MGFVSLILGAIVSDALFVRLSNRLTPWPSWVAFAALTVVSRLWILGALPALSYGAARILALRPWSTALGAALTGEGLLLAIDYIHNGLVLEPRQAVGRLVTFALGTGLTVWAVKSARRAATAP